MEDSLEKSLVMQTSSNPHSLTYYGTFNKILDVPKPPLLQLQDGKLNTCLAQRCCGN